MLGIRPFEATDAEPVAQLLQALWAHEPTMHALYNMHRIWPTDDGRIRRTLVAAINSSVVGVGTLFESVLHPRMLMVMIHVAQAWQRQGIGSALFEALARLSDGRPWLAKLTRRDVAGMSFFAKRGFHPVLTTLSGLLELDREAVQQWISILPRSVVGFQILSFTDPRSTVTLSDVAHIHAAIYRQSHMWNPPVEETTDMALAHYCGTNVISGSQVCVYRDNELVGAGNLITNPFQPELPEAYLVNMGVVERDRVETDEIQAALLRHILQRATEQNVRVRFEIDATRSSYWSLFERAPVTEVDRDFVIVANTDR